jgi:8-oxo-dGTP pyrophosphatase MutT (NUDIX family)
MKKQDLIALINGYHKKFPEDEHAQKTLYFLSNYDLFWQSTHAFGHVTASAWILSNDHSKALLTYHAKLQRWFQLGGHIEPTDANIYDASTREAIEESGLKTITLVSKDIFDIDVHLIPVSKTGFPAHWHFDIRFLFKTIDQSLTISSESEDLQWVPLDKIEELTQSESVLRMVRKTISLGVF